MLEHCLSFILIIVFDNFFKVALVYAFFLLWNTNVIDKISIKNFITYQKHSQIHFITGKPQSPKPRTQNPKSRTTKVTWLIGLILGWQGRQHLYFPFQFGLFYSCRSNFGMKIQICLKITFLAKSKLNHVEPFSLSLTVKNPIKGRKM